MTELPLLARAKTFADRIAIDDPVSPCRYGDLLEDSARIAAALLDGATDLEERRVALLASPGADYVAGQWAVWRAGGIKLPLCLSATKPEWEYALTDSRADTVLADADAADRIAPLCTRLGLRLVRTDAAPQTRPGGGARSLPEIPEDRRAMILYTSGTTSRPKGVVTTHANIRAQIESLVEAWAWSGEDRIPLFLPLHHIHGIINVVCCALWSGARLETFPRFEMAGVLGRVRERAYTLFMAVPTIYVKMIEALEAAPPEQREPVVAGIASMRLMVSGSAALPASVHARWAGLTGQVLLERYGMTEIGMALSNPLDGERRPGSVGLPLPGMEVRLRSEEGETVAGEDEPGEIQVRGPGVFAAYWDRPEATVDSFEGEWFRTGDLAVRERGYYRIMGRLSVDIIKSGGYNLSALEIESVLLEHPAIAECAVVGLPDDTWGEAVAAACVATPGSGLELEALREWCRGRLSPYKIPRRLRVVAELPRNAMGKVTKPAVPSLFDE